ncbi:MAG: putative sulfate exporter family transporter [Rhodopirellula sp.]|nr:putative sulfate exporter family transporter [Rhodopirellula sp.]MCR9208516.1 YeiH family protein [bacterium]
MNSNTPSAENGDTAPADDDSTLATPPPRPSLWKDMTTNEDWWAIWCAALLLLIAFAAVWIGQPENLSELVAESATEEVSSVETTPENAASSLEEADESIETEDMESTEDAGSDQTETKADGEQEEAEEEPYEYASPLKPYLAKPGKWTDNPLDAISSSWQGILGVFLVISALFAFANQMRGKSASAFLAAFPVVFLLATLAYWMSGQSVVKAYNLEYALWALLVGLIISNTIGTPDFLRPAISTEFFIKTGLVLLGAEVLMSRLLALGLPGVFVAWLVTPVVLITTYWFGQKILKIKSKSLNMVISADMSVCGVSAAIATAAACKAKKEELSLSIGLSLGFTVIMMAVMPAVITAMGMDPILGGAWLGGTIDSTGAVAAAGAVLGDEALEVAATVKMIQNILIGVTAFCVAIYWVTFVERDPAGPRIGISEIWYRFPKFVLGFVSMSILFSILYSSMTNGPELINAMIGGSTKTLRGWFFCLAFVSIGLETNFRQLLPQLKGGKPLVLYVCGQSLNLVLTLVVAYLMFKVVFADTVAP